MVQTNRLYNDLSWLWPLWEDVEVYKLETEQYSKLIRRYSGNEVQTLLDLGCGGGKHAYHFKRYYSVTGLDISKQMLSNAQALNPDCTFHLGDMRSFDLKKEFDALFMNDAVMYITSLEDLNKTFSSAYKHLSAGGMMICPLETWQENFKQNHTSISTSKSDNLEITFIENNYDPDTEDTSTETVLIYLIRENGKLRIENDLHITGLFSLDTWREVIKDCGFKLYEELVKTDIGTIPVYIGVKK